MSLMQVLSWRATIMFYIIILAGIQTYATCSLNITLIDQIVFIKENTHIDIPN